MSDKTDPIPVDLVRMNGAQCLQRVEIHRKAENHTAAALYELAAAVWFGTSHIADTLRPPRSGGGEPVEEDTSGERKRNWHAERGSIR